jgi:4-hydroxybenzoate polyprenyltransferase
MQDYLRLFRWPNLLVVALTQYLVRYALILPALHSTGIEPAFSHFSFFLLVLATVLITAAGYAINDYFDLRIDRINKPDKIVLGKNLSRRTAILSHSVLNLVAVVMGVYLSLQVGYWRLSFIFLVVPLILWLYSVRYKRRFFIGNFIVALLAAFVVSLVWIFEFQALANVMEVAQGIILKINQMVRFYAFFAFLTTLMREIIKDVEDVKGDEKTGCKTIPVKVGIPTTQRIILLFVISIILLLAFAQNFLFQKELYLLVGYVLVVVQLPLILMLVKTINASEKSDYSFLSRLTKFIMVGGVCSMLLVYYYLSAGASIL